MFYLLSVRGSYSQRTQSPDDGAEDPQPHWTSSECGKPPGSMHQARRYLYEYLHTSTFIRTWLTCLFCLLRTADGDRWILSLWESLCLPEEQERGVCTPRGEGKHGTVTTTFALVCTPVIWVCRLLASVLQDVTKAHIQKLFQKHVCNGLKVLSFLRKKVNFPNLCTGLDTTSTTKQPFIFEIISTESWQMWLTFHPNPINLIFFFFYLLFYFALFF